MKINIKDSIQSGGNLVELGTLYGDHHCSCLLGTDDPSCQVSNEDTMPRELFR
jgi:hypothetical protein